MPDHRFRANARKRRCCPWLFAIAFTLLRVERFDVLDRVAGLRNSQALANDLVEIHQCVFAEKAIDIRFTYTVAGHQAFQGGFFIRRVVINVHVGKH